MKFKNLALYVMIGVMAFSMSILLTGCATIGGGGGSGGDDIAPIADVIAPTVINTVPANELTDVYIDRKITATFSEVMWPATIDGTAFTVVKTDGLVSVDGTVDYDETNKIAIFTPTDVLETDTEYTATIDNEVTDMAWNPMLADKVWTFTTGADIDDAAPTVLSTIPANLDIEVAVNGNISATFSEVMDSRTITTATFTVKRLGFFSVSGAVTYVGTTAIFNPTSKLALDTQYTATITTGVKDLTDNALATNKVWTFTTEEVEGTTIANPQAPVMGETERFVILASQKVTTTGATAISLGDIGIIDQARSYYEGFTPGGDAGEFDELTVGLSFAHDDDDPDLITYSGYPSIIAFLNQVRTDLGNAYTFLAADPNPAAPTQVCPIELGTLTLTSGVYKTDANVTIQTGTLTLDAQGDATSVWIFTIDGTLTTGAPGGNIVLTNGALPENVYWRVAGITAIGAGTIFQGNVFGWEQVNVLDGADVVDGRLFSVNEQVTLIANTVTKP